MQINRRDFVKLLGGSLIGFAAGGVGEALLKIPNSVKPILYAGPRVETWKLTTCTKCPGGCGLRIRMIDDFPIQAFGNPLSPINEGGICPIGLTSIESLYHPDRLTSPMKKVNGKFQKISYSEAYGILSQGLKQNMGSAKDGKAAFVAQTESDFMANLIREFMSGMGSDKVEIDNFSANSAMPYNRITDGRPDFINFGTCDFILNFGAQFTEISESPLYFTRAINEFKAKKNEFITFSPKLTPSAYKAKRWIPVAPEYYEDAALGISYVILKDETYDKAFVQKQFKDFDAFKELILQDYSPAAVESRTGVAAEDIVTIARKFSGASSPVAYFDESILYSSNGIRNAFAVIALNGLKGFAGYGKLKGHELPDFGSGKETDKSKQAWNKNMLLGDNDVKLLMLYKNNFLFNSPNSEELRKALAGIPLVVSFSPFLDETSELANLIIPDHDDLEKLDAIALTVTGSPTVSTQQPIVKPFYSTVHTGDVLVSLVGDLKLSPKWAYKNYEDYLQTYLKPVYNHGKGMLMNQKKPTELEKSLHQAGWQLASYSSFDEFWEQMLRYGGWWDPFPKVSEYKPTLTLDKNNLIADGNSGSQNVEPKGDSLRLNIFVKDLDYKGNMARNPVLTEQFGLDSNIYYDTWVEINPATATKLSISDRSKVRIKTAKGSFKVIALHNPAVMLTNIDVPFGLGHTVQGKTFGINPLSYSDNVFDEATGTPSFSETIAMIERAGDGI